MGLATLSEARFRQLLKPFILEPEGPLSDEMVAKLTAYLELLVRWNSRTNLSAIRNPEEMVTRHLGESLFAAGCLRPHLVGEAEVLDFGSGAGLPGIPLQLAIPSCRVTLAESQGKKAAFLREAVRALELPCVVWAARVELMPPDLQFQAVTLRAVDRMAEMVAVARTRLAPRGVLLEMGAGEYGGESNEGCIRLPGRISSWVKIGF